MKRSFSNFKDLKWHRGAAFLTMLFCVVADARNVYAPPVPPPPGPGPGSISYRNCQSWDSSTNYCSIGSGATDVSVVSSWGAPCIWGQSWGWMPSGYIWVRHGCRGTFQITR